jgi:hypothetical protein
MVTSGSVEPERKVTTEEVTALTPRHIEVAAAAAPEQLDRREVREQARAALEQPILDLPTPAAAAAEVRTALLALAVLVAAEQVETSPAPTA